MKDNYLITTILLTAVVSIVTYALHHFSVLTLPNIVYPVIFVLGTMSYLFGKWIVASLNERPALFINRYMMSFLIKMMSFLIFLGAYIYLNPENKLQVAMTLFVSYLIFNVNMMIYLKISEKNNGAKKSN